MKIQAYLTAFVVNSKRIVRLIQLKKVKLKQQDPKLIQIMDIFKNKKKGAYYLKNNRLLFQWPHLIGLFYQSLFNLNEAFQ